MRTTKGWKSKQTGRPIRKIVCTGFVDEEEFQRIMQIAKRQGWTQNDAGSTIMYYGWEQFSSRWFTCDEKYDEDGNQTNRED